MYSKFKNYQDFRMLKLRSKLFVTVLAFILLQFVPCNSFVKASVSVYDLDTYIIPIGTEYARDVNDSSQCLTMEYKYDDYRTKFGSLFFLWEKGINNALPDDFEGNALNNEGQIVGKYNNQAVICKDEEIKELKVLDENYSEAFDINEKEIIAGVSGEIACFWEGETVTELGTLG